MHTITFYPVGNGDTSQIVLGNGRRILFDFHHVPRGPGDDRAEIDLKKQLRNELQNAERDYFDVVAFTHADKDHIAGSTEFFELEHAEKYKGDDRIKIRELWVPAAMLLERGSNGQQQDEFVLLRQEARHRLRQKTGIRVFSCPPELRQWMRENEIDYDSRQHLFVDAGTVAPGFTLQADGIEFFCHSPFIQHCAGGDIVRNDASLVFNVRMLVGNRIYDYLAIGDSTWEVLEDIVSITKYHGRHDRLAWDLFGIPHHCSYLALGPEKGANETVPTDLVKELLRAGKQGAYIVSSSCPVPDSKDAYTWIQPPHIQARKAYERYGNEVGARDFLVTMEEPNATAPQPLAFEFSSLGHSWRKVAVSGTAAILSSAPPRAG
jgi:hypothetical protein